jgi:hypothetical protein
MKTGATNMSEKINKEEIISMEASKGELPLRYLELRTEDTKSGDIRLKYLSLRAEDTKGGGAPLRLRNFDLLLEADIKGRLELKRLAIETRDVK